MHLDVSCNDFKLVKPGETYLRKNWTSRGAPLRRRSC
jgi:hypothetical protein